MRPDLGVVVMNKDAIKILMRQDSTPWSEVLEMTGTPESLLRELIEIGWIKPDQQAGQACFTPSDVYRLRKMNRLRLAFDLDYVAVALVMDLLERIDRMEGRLNCLERLARSDEPY